MVKRIKEKFNHHKEKVRSHYHSIVKSEEKLHIIALSFSIGTFIALTPFLGVDVFIILLIALIWKKANKISLVAPLLVFNPITQIPFQYLGFKLGDILFGSSPTVKYNIVIINHIYEYSRRFLLGNLIIAVVMSIISYFIIYQIVKYHRKKHNYLKTQL